MPNNHARRNRLLLALFFGVLSVCFGSTAAQAATQQCVGGALDGYYYSDVPFAWEGYDVLDPPPTPASGAFYYAVGTDPCTYPWSSGYALTNSSGGHSWSPAFTGLVPAGNLYRLSSTSTLPPAPTQSMSAPEPSPSPTSGGGGGGGTTGGTTGGNSDPLNGQGFTLMSDSVSVFTTYVVPVIVLLIACIYAWKMTVKLGTRFLNRA